MVNIAWNPKMVIVEHQEAKLPLTFSSFNMKNVKLITESKHFIFSFRGCHWPKMTGEDLWGQNLSHPVTCF